MNIFKWIKKNFIKPPTKNWPHQILDFLYEQYAESNTELNRFCYETLKLSDNNTTHKDKIVELLDLMETKGHLNYVVLLRGENDKGEEITIRNDYRKDFHEIGGLSLKDGRIEAQLTLDGLDHAIEIRREKQRHVMYMYATPLGAALALVAALMSTLGYIRGCGTKPLQPYQVINNIPQQQTLIQQADTVLPVNHNPDTLQIKILDKPIDSVK